jgi:transposase
MKGKHLTIKNTEEIGVRLRGEKEETVRIKLIFLNFTANFKVDLEEACEIFAIAIPTGYSWIRQWNQVGYEGIKSKGKRTGRPPRLSDEECQKLEGLLKEREYWTTKEVRGLIKERFSIEFSEDQVVRILRHRLKMHFSKPYPMDYRRPEDAEALLENQLELTLSLLKEEGLKEEDIAIGFIDEASPQNTANTVRVWSFGKVRSIKNTTRFKTNTIGFYAIRGESIEGFLENSKAESIASFLEEIRKANEGYQAVVAVIDNFPSHKSAKVKEKARELGIYLVYLPRYSPDLNPIEHIWRSIKRVLSLVFVGSLAEMKKVIADAWDKFSKKMSYAENWIGRFLKGNQYYMELCG